MHTFEKTTELVWQGHVRTMFSSKTVIDLTESFIHSYGQLINVQRFTSI